LDLPVDIPLSLEFDTTRGPSLVLMTEKSKSCKGKFSYYFRENQDDDPNN